MLITTPGLYRLRNGGLARVNMIQGDSSFPVKGSIQREFRGQLRFRGYNIWKPDGSFMAVGEHPKDIVARAEDAIDGENNESLSD